MTPAVVVAYLWILFGGTHIGLAAARPRLVARLGEIGFVAFFYVVAALTFAALVTYFAAHRFDGAPGFGLANVEPARWLLMAVIVFGFALMVAALVDYPRLPTALFQQQAVVSVRGIERITRHPFFAGTALVAGAHLLLATHLVGTVFFGGLLLLSTLGAWHQDRKLVARRGGVYAEYCAATSMLPFAAVLRGRQRLVPRELPLAALGLGIGLAVVARYGHDHLFANGGWWIVAAVVGGGAVAGINAWRRSQRLRRATRGDAPPPGARTANQIVPRLLILTGVGHMLIGLLLFRAPLGAIVQEGLLSTIRYGEFERATAFWFMLFGPACILLGQLVGHGMKRGDRHAVRLIGWNLLAMGVAGVLLMPVSGFWILIALSPWILRSTSRLERGQNAALHGQTA